MTYLDKGGWRIRTRTGPLTAPVAFVIADYNLIFPRKSGHLVKFLSKSFRTVPGSLSQSWMLPDSNVLNDQFMINRI